MSLSRIRQNLCAGYSDYYFYKQHSLQVLAPRTACSSDYRSRKGISLPAFKPGGVRKKASLTVEAALAMTLFLFAVMSLLGFFSVLRTQIQVQTALEQTGNTLAVLPDEASLAAATLVFQERMAANGVDDTQIAGGSAGVSLLYSTIMGREPIIDLVAVYRVRLPFFPEGTAELNLVQRSRKRSFGDAALIREEKEEDYVYVTPHGTVYHESLYCTYIRPVTRQVTFSQIGDQRNRNGGCYYPCSFCCAGEETAVVWVTDWGDRYHQSEHCRGLWHDVEQVPRSSVGDRKACSKCGKDSGQK